MNSKYQKILLDENISIRKVMAAIDASPIGLAAMINSQGKLKGILTDGDIRRALLNGASLDEKASKYMNLSPVTLPQSYRRVQALRYFSDKIRVIPVIDHQGKVIDFLEYNMFELDDPVDHQGIIRAKAPLRISFGGGGTDFNSYIEVQGGCVISSTIAKYCYGTLQRRRDGLINIHSLDYRQEVSIDGVENITYDGNLDLIKAVIKLMNPDFGFDLILESDVPPGSGLGGSASIAVTVAGLINFLQMKKRDEYQLAEIAYQAERIELGISGGWQDQYATVFGGFNYIEFRKEDIIVHPLRIKQEVLAELDYSPLLCFTGQTRNSGKVSSEQVVPALEAESRYYQALQLMERIAQKIKDALLRGELDSFGQLLHESWLLKRTFSNAVSNSAIDQLYEYTLAHGAIGGKVLGAGGGGYLLLYCKPQTKSQLKEKLIEKGIKILPFTFENNGLYVWKTPSLTEDDSFQRKTVKQLAQSSLES